MTLKNNETGEIRTLTSPHEHDNLSDYVYAYWWEEGNFSCDCNRHLFFNDWEGIALLEHPCGEDKYELLKIENENRENILEKENLEP